MAACASLRLVRNSWMRLRPQADDTLPPAREPAPADDHDRAGHGRRAVPRLLARTRGAEETGRADRRVAPLLRLPRSHAGLPLRGRDARLRDGGGDETRVRRFPRG